MHARSAIINGVVDLIAVEDPQAQRRDVKDLHLALVGMPVPGAQPLPVLDGETQVDLWKAAQSIDLYIWVDPKKRTYQYVRPIGATRLTEACDLFGISSADPAS